MTQTPKKPKRGKPIVRPPGILLDDWVSQTGTPAAQIPLNRVFTWGPDTYITPSATFEQKPT